MNRKLPKRGEDFASLGITSVRHLSGCYCPPSYYWPAGFLFICCCASAALYIVSALLPIYSVYVAQLQWPDSDSRMLLGTLGYCVKSAKAADDLCVKGVGVRFNLLASKDRTPEDHLDTLQQITYVFALNIISAVFSLAALFLFGIGLWLRDACFCCFGRGNIPFLSVLALSLVASIGGIASVAAFIAYAGQKTPLKVQLNTLGLIVLTLGALTCVAGWVNGVLVFMRMRRWFSFNDEPDWLQNEPVAMDVIEEETPTEQMERVDNGDEVDRPASFHNRAVNSEELLPPSQEAVPRERGSYQRDSKRPIMPTMYQPGQPRANFKRPPVYAASSHYSQSTFHPNAQKM